MIEEKFNLSRLSNKEKVELSALLDNLEREGVDFNLYRDDPEGFIEEVLGETLTPDLRRICRSVLENKVTLAKSGNGTGKSWISARLALWFFLCRYKPSVYCFAAPPIENLEDILWAHIETLVSEHPFLIADCSKKHLKITRNKREIIRGLTIPQSANSAKLKAQFSGKHAPSQLFIGDEADAAPDPCFAGIETCQSGGFDRAFYTYNPRSRAGEIYRMYKNPGSCNVITLSAFNHPSVIDGVDYFPGSVNREKTATRIAEWTRPLAKGETKNSECFEMPDYMVGVVPKDKNGKDYPPIQPGVYKVIDYQFFDVVLGEYPPQSENQLINEEWLDRAVSRYQLYTAKHGDGIPDTGINCTAGLDIAEGGRDHSVLTLKFGNLVLPQVVWSKKDPLEVGDLAYAEIEPVVNRISAINCDGNGLGSGTAPHMIRQYNVPAVKVMVQERATEDSELGKFGILLDQLMWSLRMWLKNDLAMIPPDNNLIDELLAFDYEVKKGKVKVSSTDDVKKKLRRSPDRARSLMLCFHKNSVFDDFDFS
jgi:hypothetical protein